MQCNAMSHDTYLVEDVITELDNDAVFKSWRAEVGTDRETTQRIVHAEFVPVNYEYGAKQHG